MSSDRSRGTPTIEFSHAGFSRLVNIIVEHGYVPRRLDQSSSVPNSKIFFLRFDIDISPTNALALGRLAAKRDFTASFFLQLNAETYCPFTQSTLETVRELRRLGHCVGLHVDEHFSGADEWKVAATLDWFDDCVTPINRVVSFHRPTQDVLGRGYATFRSAYGPDVFATDRYLSDSRRSAAFWPRLLEWLSEARSPMQLLLHPEWWLAADSGAAIRDAIHTRRRHELDRYLSANFGKVFGHLIDHEDRNFRL